MGLWSPFQASEARPRRAVRATTPRIAADARGAAMAPPTQRSWRSMCVLTSRGSKVTTALPTLIPRGRTQPMLANRGA